MPYEHQEYPKWRYHATQKPVIVQSEEEHVVLTPAEEGWTSELKDLVAKDSFLGRKRKSVKEESPVKLPISSD